MGMTESADKGLLDCRDCLRTRVYIRDETSWPSQLSLHTSSVDIAVHRIQTRCSWRFIGMNHYCCICMHNSTLCLGQKRMTTKSHEGNLWWARKRTSERMHAHTRTHRYTRASARAHTHTSMHQRAHSHTGIHTVTSTRTRTHRQKELCHISVLNINGIIQL